MQCDTFARTSTRMDGSSLSRTNPVDDSARQWRSGSASTKIHVLPSQTLVH